jgi:phosphate transport system substrate-binding protein
VTSMNQTTKWNYVDRVAKGKIVFVHEKVSVMRPFIASFLTLAVAAAMSVPAGSATVLTGAGPSFIYSFFVKASDIYNQKNPNVTVTYHAISSGGGIQRSTPKNVDFGATDVPMKSEELARAGKTVLQIPVTLSGVAIAYNLPGVTATIKLTRQAITDIYLGKILKWNDPQIVRLNKGVKLPDMSIDVVHRSDGSGTSYIFTDFLSHVSPEWKSKVGTGKSVAWPSPSEVGAKGNEGVAAQIRSTPGAIGYVELPSVLESHMPAAFLQNRSGKWVACSEATVTAAAAKTPAVSPTDVSVVDASGANSYPISGYAWVLFYKKQPDSVRAKILHDVLLWLVGPQGQSIAKSVGYVPLPPNVQASAAATLKEMQH